MLTQHKRKNMQNYITKKEYGSFNQGVLAEAGFNHGDEFLTFKQALKIDGITGQSMKRTDVSYSIYCFSFFHRRSNKR